MLTAPIRQDGTILEWETLFGLSGSSNPPAATEATLLAVKVATQSIDTKVATEATQGLVKNLLTSIDTKVASEPTLQLVKNLLTTIDTKTTALAKEATLQLIKSVLDNQLQTLSEIRDNNIPVVIEEALDVRTFIHIKGFRDTAYLHAEIADIFVEGNQESIEIVEWGNDDNNDNIPDIDSSNSHDYNEYGIFFVKVKTQNNYIFEFVLPNYVKQNTTGKEHFDFYIKNQHDGRNANFRYFKLFQKTVSGLTIIGDFDFNGNPYSPILPDDGKLKQIEDNNTEGRFNYPETFDISSDFVLKPFKFHEISIQPLAGSDCRIRLDNDPDVSLQPFDIDRTTASTQISRTCTIHHITGTIRIKTLR